ncbi:uncharacterized protein LOC62_01G000516 [Vanrija pseudolonga]|uniref:Uncharacterized protein n=1 Tax=Vanrija pseudolonga TaxID=143232 RepID=A0AAF1BMN4_9TREE|nr:hypothetical protein LOC62_01G000516 [Vanrija pseudolonga]
MAGCTAEPVELLATLRLRAVVEEAGEQAGQGLEVSERESALPTIGAMLFRACRTPSAQTQPARPFVDAGSKATFDEI